MQGYLFSSAQPSDKIMDLFARHRARLAGDDGAGLASAGAPSALPGREQGFDVSEDQLISRRGE
jgi:hypothetical protein